MTEEEIFTAAIEIADRRARKVWLDEACAGDRILRASLDKLLALHDTVGDFLETPALGCDPGDDDVQPGSVVDRYRLVRRIGEGGFGVVWRAEQIEPVQRDVALKIIKPGRVTSAVIDRFESERQALAMMNHPNIATVLDAGTLDCESSPKSGRFPRGAPGKHSRPYFVMELVDGLPIDRFCDEQMPVLADRLRLFITVCRAVQHAHEKGIVHRDLKPSNVLVSVDDGVPHAEVIDFGIAKAMHLEQHDDQPVAGTPAYMSPEQLIAGADVDTRSDIYALGGVLYRLITGFAPVGSSSLRGKSVEVVRRMICEDTPVPPLERLSAQSANDTKNGTSFSRSELQPLGKDPDWIVMKALAKDRADRYESASELARDIERCLANEPVSAAPDSAAYRARKFIRRNRLAVSALALVSAALVAGVSVAMFGLIEAEKEHQKTRVEWQRAEREKLNAQRERAVAEEQRKRAVDEADKAVRFAQMLEDMIASAGPDQGNPADYTMREQLEEFAGSLSDQLEGHPEIESRIRRTIGRLFLTLREATRAGPHLERALELRRSLLGNDHPLTIQSQVDRASYLCHSARLKESEQTLTQVLPRLREAEPGDELIEALEVLSEILRTRGDFQRGNQVIREIADVTKRVHGDSHPLTLIFRSRAAVVRVLGDDLEEIDRITREALERILTLRPEDHVDVARIKRSRAMVLLRQQKLAPAEDLARQSIDVYRRVIGPDSYHVLESMSTLTYILDADGRVDEALAVAREAVEISERQSADGDRKRILTYSDLARLARPVDLRESVRARRMAIQARKNLLPDHQSQPGALRQLAHDLWQLGDLQDAAKCYREALDAHRQQPNAPRRLTLLILRDLADLLLISGEPAAAEPLLREAIALSDGKPLKPVLRIDQLQSLIEANNFESVRRLADSLETEADEDRTPDASAVAAVAGAQLMMARSDFDEAARILNQQVDELNQHTPRPARLVSRINSLRAQCLIETQAFESAQTLLLRDSRKSERKAFQVIDRRRIARQLVTLYEAWDKPDEAARWRERMVRAMRTSNEDEGDGL